jgi:predicted esterase
MIRDGIGVDALSDSARAVLDAARQPWLRRMVRRATGERPDWLPGGLDEAERFDVSTAVALAQADAGGGRAERGVCTTSPLWTEAVLATRRRPWKPEGARLEFMTTEGFEGWPYVVRVPPGYRGDVPSPLLVFLSGNSGPAISGQRTANQALRDTEYLTVYPQADGVWWDASSAAMLDALMEEIWRTYNVDPERVYLTGLSNGGTGTFLFSTLWPHRFAAAVSAMGAGLFTPPDAPFPHPENTRSLPLRFLHGTEDDVILPGSSVQTVENLGPREAPADVRMFSGLGHQIFIGRTDNDLTLEFFEEHSGRPFPRVISYRSDDAASPRHYWLSILEADIAAAGPDSPVAVNAVINGRKIELSTRHVRRFGLHLRRELIPGEGPIEVVVNGQTVYEGPVEHSCDTLERSVRLSADPHLAWTAELQLDVPGAGPGR